MNTDGKGSVDDNYLLTSAPASSQLTLTTEPVAMNATAMTQTAFSANWLLVPGAIKYYIDVSEDVGFATFVPTYQNN